MSYFRPAKYVKDEPPTYLGTNFGFFLRSRLVPLAIPLFALFIVTTQIIVPLVFFKTQDQTSDTAKKTLLAHATGFSDFTFTELNQTEKAQAPESKILGRTTQMAQETHFNISIPKLKIENALVEINEPTLQPDNVLGHYTGSALPGEPGNAFIYGHSVLPFFYNPANYKTIFSTINKLEPGDEIIIKRNNQLLTYKVIGQRELKPINVDPLGLISPRYLNESTLVLMTCYPMGTKINRLLVDAVLIEK